MSIKVGYFDLFDSANKFVKSVLVKEDSKGVRYYMDKGKKIVWCDERTHDFIDGKCLKKCRKGLVRNSPVNTKCVKKSQITKEHKETQKRSPRRSNNNSLLISPRTNSMIQEYIKHIKTVLKTQNRNDELLLLENSKVSGYFIERVLSLRESLIDKLPQDIIVNTAVETIKSTMYDFYPEIFETWIYFKLDDYFNHIRSLRVNPYSYDQDGNRVLRPIADRFFGLQEVKTTLPIPKRSILKKLTKSNKLTCKNINIDIEFLYTFVDRLRYGIWRNDRDFRDILLFLGSQHNKAHHISASLVISFILDNLGGYNVFTDIGLIENNSRDRFNDNTKIPLTTFFTCLLSPVLKQMTICDM